MPWGYYYDVPGVCPFQTRKPLPCWKDNWCWKVQPQNRQLSRHTEGDQAGQWHTTTEKQDMLRHSMRRPVRAADKLQKGRSSAQVK